MRSGGILMHISSLPSRGGIGDLGPEAYAFADFLVRSGMKIWQVLPVGPTGYGESPYQSPSAFAGNPLFLSLEKLREEGRVSFTDDELWIPSRADQVCFDEVRERKTALLRRAFREDYARSARDVEGFCAAHPWVDDFAFFTALKEHFGGGSWESWPEAVRHRKAAALLPYREKLADEIRLQCYWQFLFHRQWAALKKYCNDQGILLFGDMPIYVAADSADAWSHPGVFQLDKNLIPTRVAGVPPDYFSEDGQLWGNPLYRWHRLFFRRYDWWVERMKGMAERFDMVRIDHFIGFANYYSVPYGAPNARKGKWVVGPGKKLFRQLKKEVPSIRVIAEDLGEVNDRVRKLLSWTGYPGMKVLCFGFDGNPGENVHFPSREHYTENYACYTGTHDNDTILGWAEKASPEALDLARKTLGFKEIREAPAAFVHAVFASGCNTAIAPMQDILGLDGSARMNFPGTVGGNWGWRMAPDQLTPDLAAGLKALVRETGR